MVINSVPFVLLWINYGFMRSVSHYIPFFICISLSVQTLLPQKTKHPTRQRLTCRSLLRMRPIAGKEPSPRWYLMSHDLAAWSSWGSIKINPRDWAKDFSTNAVNLEEGQKRCQGNIKHALQHVLLNLYWWWSHSKEHCFC